VNTAVRAIKETIANAGEDGMTRRPRADAYLTMKEPTAHGHFTLRERREPKKRPMSAGSRGATIAGDGSSQVNRAQANIFAPSRKPTASGGASFLRDTGRSGSVGAARSRVGGGIPRPGAKTMVIDVAEAAQLGATSQIDDPLRAQAQEERDRKRQREKEAKEQRMQRLMQEIEAKKQRELTRKRERDEEILEKKKAYRAEIEAKRANKRVASIATPSPTDEPATW
jgi:hypothetical protein|tara:strand:- start:5651 stop:6328 length:678 start_codon:yes stop_codon:yes gene_type:complete